MFAAGQKVSASYFCTASGMEDNCSTTNSHPWLSFYFLFLRWHLSKL